MKLFNTKLLFLFMEDERVQLGVVLENYTEFTRIGKGSMSTVYKATDKRTNEVVCIKKMHSVFESTTNSLEVYRAVLYMMELEEHKNFINLIDIKISYNENDIFLIMEYRECDLHAVCRADILEDIHIRYVVYQLLLAIHYLHSGDLFHRYLRPDMILINEDCTIKLSSFDEIKSVHVKYNEPEVYACAKWYKTPEEIFGANLSKKSDIWYIGCILAELVNKRPIFPGTSTMNQLERIIQLVGCPSPEDIASFNSPYASTMLESCLNDKFKSLSFIEAFPSANDDCIDLLSKLLQFNPLKRIDTLTALQHPYLKEFYNEDDIKTCESTIRIMLDLEFYNEDDVRNISIYEYRSKITKDIINRLSNSQKE